MARTGESGRVQSACLSAISQRHRKDPRRCGFRNSRSSRTVLVKPEKNVNAAEEIELAWVLLDWVSPSLSRTSRTRLYAQLGAGECGSTIRQILETCHLDGAGMPAELVDGLRNWAAGYEQSESATTLRALIAAICTASSRSTGERSGAESLRMP